MFKTNINSRFFLLRDEADVQNASMEPMVGDLAELKLEEQLIDIHVRLIEKIGENWKGIIQSYHSKGKVSNFEERLDQIKADEKHINNNSLKDSTEISFERNKIFGVYRNNQ